jgi:hypothetical protein
MFPIDFAFQVVRDYCPDGGFVFDPFAGRGSSIYAAAAQGRMGLGIELNPVGWVYSKAKLHPASKGAVLRRLRELENITRANRRSTAQQRRYIPEFFKLCYTQRVLQFLLTARQELDWQNRQTDATLMAILLVYLHAKAGSGLSNQMRQSKAMSPPYAIRWWREHGTQPPDIDPVEWILERIEWRYATGLPQLQQASVWLGDSIRQATQVNRCISRGHTQLANLLFTSPPYFAVTNYQYDQWLRLWLLGYPPQPVAAKERSRGRFQSKVAYRQLLLDVFSKSVPLLHEDAIIYVRTDAREFTRTTTETILRQQFPHKQIDIQERPYNKTTQTSLFGDDSSKPGEVDVILSPKPTY